jgi:predicted nucleic acid-binding protein
MAKYLLDTNLLLRLTDSKSPHNQTAAQAIARLLSSGDQVFITAQNLLEFWAVATRPVDANGFGWPHERSAAELELIQSRFPMLEDTAEIFRICLDLIKTCRITGKRVHDARLGSIAIASKMDHILTFNTRDFSTLGISVIDPNTIIPTSLS